MNSAWAFQLDTLHNWAYWDGVFTKEECETIIGYGKTLQKGLVVGNGSDELSLHTEVRDSEICWIAPSKENAWLFRRLTDVITNLNKNYFGFDLFGITESLQLTKYKAPSGFYGSHIDKVFGSDVRKLSITVQLSDPADYEGGDLRLYFSKNPLVMDKKLGKLIAFPSYTLHEVTPVTKGTRYSLVAWITGNQFK